jgi:hypothetical protein
MRRLRYHCGIALVCIAMSVPTAWAQQQTQSQSDAPIPAYHSPLAGASGADNDNSTANGQQLEPDTRPLAGAQDLSLGVPPETHSYWQPNVHIVSTTDSNALAKSNNSTGWTEYLSVLGGIDLTRISGNSNLTLSYVGGGSLTNNGTVGNSVIQELSVHEQLVFHRSVLSFFDNLAYLPEISFGYGGIGGIALPYGGSIGLQNGFLPGQTILTPRGQRLTNSFITEDNTHLTSKSSLTFVGGYSLLHYIDSDLLNYGDIIFQGGYNRQLTKKDTIAVFYRFNGYRYSNFDQSINDNSFQASYGRRVTGKLAFEVAGGPDVAFSKVPFTAGASTTQLYWSLRTSLTYQLKRTTLSFWYNHGLSGGSGVLGGSVADVFSGSARRQLSRTLSGTWNLGYSRNKGLFAVGGTTPATASQTFDYWFTGVDLRRPLGRTMEVFLNYQLQYQNSNSGACTGVSCGTNIVRNTVSLGFTWLHQPIVY